MELVTNSASVLADLFHFASAAVAVDSSHMTASSSASWSRFSQIQSAGPLGAESAGPPGGGVCYLRCLCRRGRVCGGSR